MAMFDCRRVYSTNSPTPRVKIAASAALNMACFLQETC